MQSLQLALHRLWDRLDDSFLVSWSYNCFQDLLWWMDSERLLRGVSLSQLSPDLTSGQTRPTGNVASSTISSASLALVIVIAVSTDFVFMPGNSSDLPGLQDSPPGLLLRLT